MRPLMAERLSFHLPLVLERSKPTLTCHEVNKLLRIAFGRGTTFFRIRQEMQRLSPGTERLFSVTLCLLGVEQGNIRVGNLTQVVQFCQEQATSFDLGRMAGEALGQDQFVNEVRRSFPKEKEVLGMEFAGVVLAKRYLEHLARQDTAEPLPIFLIDGPSGIGKSTIAKMTKKHLEVSGRPAIVVGLDMFLKEEAWRREQIARIICGQIDAKTYDESAFLDLTATMTFFGQVRDFRESGENARVLYVNNAFDSGTKRRIRKEYPLAKGTIIIIEGKYALLAPLRPFYGRNAFTARLKKKPETIRNQFVTRGGRRFADQGRLAWYDIFLQSSFERYAAQTARFLKGVLNMEPTEELD